MRRTAEQVEADDALAAAVQRCWEVYVPDRTGVITEFIVTYASRSFDDDGDDRTAIGRIVSIPAPPVHHQLGMLEYSVTEYRSYITRLDEED